MKLKFVSGIGGATLSLVFISFFSKSIGFVREIIFAGKFGLSAEYDLFLVSSIIPITINTAIMYLVQHYFIPAYNGIQSKNNIQANTFFNYTFQLFLGIGTLVALILFVFSHYIIDIYFGSQPYINKKLAQNIFLLFLITIPINSGMSVIFSYLQSNFRFILPAFLQVIMNIIIILIVFLFGDSLKILVLPISFTIAYSMAFLLILYFVKEKIKFRFGNLSLTNYNLPNHNFILYLIFIEALSLSYSIVDRYFYGRIIQGGIAALNYAMNIYNIPISIFTIALVTVVFSKFSKDASRDVAELEVGFVKSVDLNIYLMMPLTIILIYMSDSLIQIFYERGKFSSEDTLLTFEALKYYSISIIFYSSYLIVVKLLYSISKYRLVFIGSIFAFIVKVIFSFLLFENYQHIGLAASTSIVYVFLFFYGAIIVFRKIKITNKIYLIKQFLYATINVLMAYLVIIIVGQAQFSDLGIFKLLKIVLLISIYIFNSKLIGDSSYIMLIKTLNDNIKYRLNRISI